MPHKTVTDDIRTTAALYSLGALSHGETLAFEQHIEGCELCGAEVRSFDSAVAQLPLAVPEVQPPPDLRDRVLNAIEDSHSGVRVVRSTEGEWKRTPFPGVTMKSLHLDPETGMMTNLVRMREGASYPPHRHTEAEQCLVLEGDVRLDDIVLGPGDYSRNDAFTNHGLIHTKGGCLLLIISSAKDEILAGR